MIKELPKYSGCRTIEYIPVVFNIFAYCCLVFRPDVPIGTYPIVIIRIISPKYDIAKETIRIFPLFKESFLNKYNIRINNIGM